MFNTLEEVPEILKEFYLERSVSEPTGEINLVEVEDLDGDAHLVSQPVMRDVVYLAEKPRVFVETEARLLLFVERMNHDNIRACAERILESKKWAFHDEYVQWLLAPDLEEPTYPTDTVASILAATDYETRCLSERKLAGVLFEGKRCSATKEDMWGLSSILSVVQAGMSVPFEFDSGDALVLTPDNLADFQAVWVPFRLSFFQG